MTACFYEMYHISNLEDKYVFDLEFQHTYDFISGKAHFACCLFLDKKGIGWPKTSNNISHLQSTMHFDRSILNRWFNSLGMIVQIDNPKWICWPAEKEKRRRIGHDCAKLKSLNRRICLKRYCMTQNQ